MTTRIQVVFYSMYGHIYKMAEAIAAGAREVKDTEVTLLQVPELVPDDVLEKSGAKAARAPFAKVPFARPDQLAEADAIIFGTPTRFGNMPAQMRNFLDQTGGLWMKGALIGKVGSVFTSSATQHGGQESTILSFHTTLLHQGMVIVGVPYSEQRQMTMSEISGGSPYGASTITGGDGSRQPFGQRTRDRALPGPACRDHRRQAGGQIGQWRGRGTPRPRPLPQSLEITHMNLQLDGKTALVTGSTLGIGFAIARALAGQGARVTVNGRTDTRVTEAVARLRAEVPAADVTGVAADLATADGVARLVAIQPDVDILVNNLGIFEPKPFEEIPDADWRRFFEVNVLSGVRLARLCLPAMKRANWGRIIFISSESGVQIPAEMIHYGMTKSAQLAVARGLAETTAGTGVTVNSVLPGPTASEGVAGFVGQLAKDRGVSVEDVEREFFQSTRPSSLLKRFARPDEVGSMVAYISSSLASATNGAAVRVDGGCVRSMI